MPLSNPIQVDYKTDMGKLLDIYKSSLLKNKEIYFLAGELNPEFYNGIIDECYDLIKDATVNVICGPYVSVEDDLFREYYEIQGNRLGNWWYAKRRGEWWKIHPIFNKAHDNKNIKIYITKKRQEPHFFVGADNSDILIEDSHEELNEAHAKIYLNDKEKANNYINKWNEIKENTCVEFDWESEKRLFKPIYKFKRELDLKEEIEKDFPKLPELQIS